MVEEEDTERFLKCFRFLQNSFSTYNQAVEVISCLELFFEDAYRDEVDCFDRFPRFHDPELTPDATILFRNNYGLVLEFKRTFPQHEEGFLDDIRQVKKYDSELALRCLNGGTRIPNVMDIVLLIKMDNANEIFTKFLMVCEEEGIELVNNLVFMEYYYDSSNTVSKYVFRKWAGKNTEFRDDLGENGLEETLGKMGKSIKISPDQAMERKLTRVFINDQPPEIYTVVFLWTKVIYNLLTEEQKELWRIEGERRTLSLNLDIDDMVSFINEEIIKEGRVRRPWVVKALDFLDTCGLVEHLPDGKVRILYRNLRQMVGSRKYVSNGQQEFERIRDYGAFFADQYCRRLLTSGEGPSRPPLVSAEKKSNQKTLGEY